MENSCKNLARRSNKEQFICSECGVWISGWTTYTLDNPGKILVCPSYTYTPSAFAFCPMCGRKVIGKAVAQTKKEGVDNG